MRYAITVSEQLQLINCNSGSNGITTRIDHTLHQWLSSGIRLVLLFATFAETPFCSGTCASFDESSLPAERNRYAHEVCWLDSGRPEVAAFEVALKQESVSTYRFSQTGRVWLAVAERDWRKTQIISRRINFSTLPADGPIASYPSYPEAIRQSFFFGDLVSTQKQLVAMEPPSGETVNPAIARALEECKFRLHLEENAVQIPTALEWRKMAAAMQRRENADYLLNRVALSRGERVVNGLVIPGSVPNIEYAELRGKRYVVPGIEDDALIDPFTELYKMDLTADELQVFVPVLTTEHTFIPIEDVADKPIRLIPSSRYCYCVIINSVLGRPNVIREYDLTDEEWRDAGKVAALIERANASVAEK